MPELPEVETVRRGLAALLPGRTVADVTFDWPKGFPNTSADVQKFLIGSSVQSIRRRGKVLVLELDSSYSLVVHLKMTGQLVFVREDRRTPEASLRFGAGHPSLSLVGQLPDSSTRVTIKFEDGSYLYFNDQRKFGWMRLLPTIEVSHIDFFQKIGPEPLEHSFDKAAFRQRFIRRKKSSIKAALLDQSVIAGVGNIYADESLWAAQIHPQTLVGNVTLQQLDTLFIELRAVLHTAIDKGGSTDKNYVNAEGKKGSYMDFARVFRRQGQPCLRCTGVIDKIRVAGRGTHICSTCQRLPQ